MYTKTWVLDTVERLVKTFLQVFIATLLASGMDLTKTVTDTSILQKAGLAGLSAALSLVFSIVSAWVNNNGTASVVPTITTTEPVPPPHGEGE